MLKSNWRFDVTDIIIKVSQCLNYKLLIRLLHFDNDVSDIETSVFNVCIFTKVYSGILIYWRLGRFQAMC